VGVLQAFERRLGGLVEGAFAKVFKGDVQPVEIAGALMRESDDRKTVVGQGRVLVPNEFTVELGDHDHARLAEWAEPLGEELAAMVREHAAEQRYSFVGRVHVGFAHVPEISTGVFRVRSTVLPDDHPDTPDAPETPVAPETPTAARRAHLDVTTGTHHSSFVLNSAVTVIGRATDSDLRLEDPGVSRRHAEIRVTDKGGEITDLGSTNGVRLNGTAVTSARLHDGDRIDLGSTSLVFRRGGS
jgi:hypothetical protein